MSRTPPSNRDEVVDELVATFNAPDTSLVDLVDSLLDKGVVVDGEVVLGLAGIDLIYLRLAALLAAADRVMDPSGLPRAGQAHPRGPAVPQSDVARSVTAPYPDVTPQDVQSRPPHGRAPSPTAPPEHEYARAGSRRPPSEYGRARSPSAPPVTVHAAPAESMPATNAGEPVSRWNPDPDEVRKGVTKLVLALAEFIKQLLERRAVRRMEAGTLTDAEVERLGTALAQVEDTLRDMAERAGLDPSEINLDLGPLGTLV